MVLTNSSNLDRFADLGFDDFRRMAGDDSLSGDEKVGFPESYRAGKHGAIVADILSKVGPISAPGGTLLDIGPGCSSVAVQIIEAARSHAWNVVLVDSAEMLDRLPEFDGVAKHAAYFPDCPDLLGSLKGRVDAIVVYSVLHYVFREGNPWRLLDECLALLAPGGRMLLGDIPNVSKRRRFFTSAAGIEYHKRFMRTDEPPSVEFNVLERGVIDDSVVMSLIWRARLAGYDAFVVPQGPDLPMANRREDILIVKP